MDESEESRIIASVVMAVRSDEARHWSDFQGIAASVVMALQRASQARLTGDLLRLAAFSARTIPPDTSSKCDELRNQLVEIQDGHLHSFGRELRRSTLITAIGILDFSLVEILLFMVSIRPDVLNRLPENCRKSKKGKEPLEFAKYSLKRSGIETLLERVREVLQIEVPKNLEDELSPLLEKRHAITHRSKFYETVLIGDKTVLQEHAFPEVSYDESTIALITVTEIADCVLVGVAKEYFHSDLGDLRPLNPVAEEFSASMRLKIQEARARGPNIEMITNPNWRVLVRDEWVCVTDENTSLTISPTGMDYLPASIFCPKHDVHGENIYVSIDNGEREKAGFMDASFLARLLAGESILVEYQSNSSDVPLYRRLPLEGFALKWVEAQRRAGCASPPRSSEGGPLEGRP